MSNVCVSGFLNGYIFVQRESEAVVFPVRVVEVPSRRKKTPFDISQPGVVKDFGYYVKPMWFGLWLTPVLMLSELRASRLI